MRRAKSFLGAICLWAVASGAQAAEPVQTVTVQPGGWSPVAHVGAALLSVNSVLTSSYRPLSLRIDARPAAVRWDGKARFSFPVGADQAGFALSGSARRIRPADASQPFRSALARTITATMGWWADEGALEFGIFQEQGGTQINPLARTVQLASGRKLCAHGVKMSASLYEQADPQADGWSLNLDARQQNMTDVDAALLGRRGRTSEGRIALSGKLKF